MFFKLVLKGFKLKKLIVEPKIAQSVEPDEEPIDPPAQFVEGYKNLISLPKRLFNWSRCEQ